MALDMLKCPTLLSNIIYKGAYIYDIRKEDWQMGSKTHFKMQMDANVKEGVGGSGHLHVEVNRFFFFNIFQ